MRLDPARRTRRRHVPLINDEYGCVCSVPWYPGNLPPVARVTRLGWDANEGRDYDDVWPPAPARRDTAAFRTSCEDKL